MKLIHAGKVVAEITTNHGMTVEEAASLVADEIFPCDDSRNFDECNCIINGQECWYELLEMDYDDED